MWAIVNPWDKINIDDIERSYLENFSKNRSKHNLKFNNKFLNKIKSKIYSWESAESQVIQFEKLIDKIKINGYKDNFDDLPTAIIFLKK